MKKAVVGKGMCLFIQEHNTQLGYLNMNLRIRSRSVQEMICYISITLNSIALFPNVEPKLQGLQNADPKKQYIIQLQNSLIDKSILPGKWWRIAKSVSKFKKY